MRGADQKYFEIAETTVTVNAEGTALSAGATITFNRTFSNMPSAVVIPLLGSVDLDHQVGTIWELSVLSTTGCTVGIVDTKTLPAAYWSKDIKVAVFAHEQL